MSSIAQPKGANCNRLSGAITTMTRNARGLATTVPTQHQSNNTNLCRPILLTDLVLLELFHP